MAWTAVCSRRLLHFDLIQNAMSRAFRWYATIVCHHPYTFIFVPIVATVLLSCGIMLRWPLTDAILLYTPLSAIAHQEKAIFHQKWPLTDGAYVPGRSLDFRRQCQVIITAKDGGNVLRPHIGMAVSRLNNYIIHGIAVADNGESYYYSTLCMESYGNCHTNRQVEILQRMYDEPSAFGRLTFPRVKIFHHEMYLGQTLGGVVTTVGNGSLSDRSTPVVEARAWLLSYQLRFGNPRDDRLSGLWELAFEQALLKYKDPLIEVSAMHSQTLDIELSKNGQNLGPKITACFVVLILFATACTLSVVKSSDNGYAIDWNRSAPWLAVAGVFSAGMGVATAVGLLSVLGVYFCEVISVMPFLVISVRLDNTFLMLSALSHTKAALPAEERIPDAMAEAAVSITITVLTDVISFGVGYLTDFLAVQLFCLYTCVAMITSFLFQLTLLLGLIVLHARNECEGRHTLCPCFKTAPSNNDKKNVNFFLRLFCVGSTADKTSSAASVPECSGGEREMTVTGGMISKWFMNTFGSFLTHRFGKIAVIALYIAYLAIAIYGCTQIREGLEPVNLLVEDSYATKFYSNMQNYFWPYGTTVQIAFNSPGDVADPYNRFKIVEAVKEFAESQHGTGTEGLQFWLLDFDNSLPIHSRLLMDDIDEKQFYEHLTDFFHLYPYKNYASDVLWNGRNGSIEAITSFRLMVGVKNFSTALEQMETLDAFRKIAAKYSDFNITTYNHLWPFIEQYKQVLPNVFQELYSGMLCMIAIALLFIPNPLGAIWVTISMASIDAGVVGYMTLWGLNIDCITMITLIMSIGFSVDFSAHIAYSYAVNEGVATDERIRMALGGLGWPIVQGGLSTILGVVVLADVKSYMFVAFCKTVLLIIVIGVLHGIVFLPVLISLADLKPMLIRRSHNNGTSEQQPNDGNNGAPPPALHQGKLGSRWQRWLNKFSTVKLASRLSKTGCAKVVDEQP